jgi:hypothetical protein
MVVTSTDFGASRASRVIHIGFLSSKTNTFSGPKIVHVYKSPAAFRFACAVVVLCRETLTYRTTQAPSSCFAPASSLGIYLSSPPAVGSRLFRAVIHPDLGRGGLRRRRKRRAPSRPRRDQNIVSTAPCSLVRPSRRTSVTVLVTWPRRTRPSTPPDSGRGRKRFQ